jgi:hypothetical protein
MKTLRQTAEDNYVTLGEVTMQREYGATPNGNPLGGKWVLRVAGDFVDYDQYRTDLAERNGFRFESLEK